MDSWSISEAKSRFSELVSCVSRDGPQTVTRNGEAVALIVSPQVFKVPTPGGDYGRLPRVREPGLTLNDADVDALFLSARTPCGPTRRPKPASPQTLGAPQTLEAPQETPKTLEAPQETPETLEAPPAPVVVRTLRHPPMKGLRALAQAYALVQG